MHVKKRRRKKKTKGKTPTIPIRKRFGGKICIEIPREDLCRDDYIIYWDNGYRAAKVLKNHKGYKHRWVRLYASEWRGHVLRRSKKIKHEKIKSVWRPATTEQLSAIAKLEEQEKDKRVQK